MGITGGDSGNGVGDGVVNKEQREKLRELALAATPQDFDSAAEEMVAGGVVDCPVCGGEGTVELLSDYCNYDDTAIGVQFYGVGPEHGAAETYYRAAKPSTVLALLDRIDELEAAAEVESAEPVGEIVETGGSLAAVRLYSPAFFMVGDKLYRHPPSAVPEGWKLVPVEPTPEMLSGLVGPAGYCSMPLADAYKAMLAATGDSP
jgi:hypothetical protein